jgi:hypothetical protein
MTPQAYDPGSENIPEDDGTHHSCPEKSSSAAADHTYRAVASIAFWEESDRVPRYQ